MPLVDLDTPEELRARWTALAAVAHATGFDRRWYADEEGYHHQDETGSVLRMVQLDDKAVLFGFHTQHSRTAGSDLLAGSPDWIGQPEVKRRLGAGELGFVYGAVNGTWARASYPGDPWQPLDDGFAPIGQWITSDSESAREMIEWVAEWTDYLGGLDELEPAGVRLIRTAASSGITAGALAEFFDVFGIDPRSPLQPDLPAGVVAADDFTRNFAAGARLDDEPDTAEVSVVEEVVTGTSEGRPVDEDESFVVPPGISPFTGQPIDEPSYHVEPVARDQEYGITGKKQGWFRRRKPDEAAEPAEPDIPFQAGPPPGTFLPSSEPPRVGGGVHEGDDFYASLFADAPYQSAAPADEQDWETAERPVWPDEDATGSTWVGGAWIDGEWVEDPASSHLDPPSAAQPVAPSTPLPAEAVAEDDDAPTAEIPAVIDEEPASFTGPSPFAPGAEVRAQVEPHPQPEPWPEPQPRPEPWPEPEPRPAPWPEPGPEPSPRPEPAPGPGPWPEPEPSPAPEPEPEPWPEPEPEPEPEPWPHPEPEPRPTPEPEPAPWPDPEPSPEPGPWPRSEPLITQLLDTSRPEPLSRPAEVAAAVRMSIPGLGLVGSDGPRLQAPPGSLEEAMRSEVERPRPRPRESEAFDALRAWCRARTAIVPSGFTIQVQVLDPAHPSYRFDLEPPDVDDPEYAADKLSGLLGDLWLTEAESEQGGWLFARMDAAGRTLRIDRWYDQVPDWWDNPVEPRLDAQALVRRLTGRGPEWQPSYLERLYSTAR